MKEFIRTETIEKDSKVTEYEITDMIEEDKVRVMDAVIAEAQPELFEPEILQPVVKEQLVIKTPIVEPVEVKYYRHICHNDENRICELIEIDPNEVSL